MGAGGWFAGARLMSERYTYKPLRPLWTYGFRFCGSIGSIGLPHACLPFVKAFPGVSAGGSNVHTSIVAGLDSKGVPCPCVFLVAMEQHMFFSSDFILLA